MAEKKKGAGINALVPDPLENSGKIPPHATELEQAVLGALMLEKDALLKVSDILHPNVFYDDRHSKIYEAIVRLSQRSEPIDILTVTEELRKLNYLDDVGGPYYITELTARVASAANIEYHARIIAQKYIAREMIRVSGEIIRDAYEDQKDVFEQLDKAEQEFFKLSELNFKKNYAPVGNLVIEVLEQIEELRNRPDAYLGIGSGFVALDRMTQGFHKSELTIIAARPSMGKTAFVLSVARNMAVLFKKAVAIFSLEMPAHAITQRLIAAETEIDAQKLRAGKLDPHELDLLHKKTTILSNAPIIIDDTAALSIDELRSKCRRLKVERNIECVIIDYLQLMHVGDSSKSMNREQEIAKISRSLKNLAKDLDIPVIALSQLSRGVESRPDKRPQLSDLRESGSIEQDADVVMFLYRPEYYGLDIDPETGFSNKNVAEVIIGKQRNGPTGKVRLKFLNQFVKFVNDDEELMSTALIDSLQPSTSFDIPQDTNNTDEVLILPSKINQRNNLQGPSTTSTTPPIDEVPF
ncbi:MAG: replicative DNA helicase [Bacteroidia bacterium]|nr:replicative DNA helicase [Bacteroidia bacterium]MDW8301251.1 replicative DNA helicase [Bacteroidia bacterium]